LAQDPEPDPPAKLYTLHVYANLIQVPTLVLTPQLALIHSLTREQFSISLDDGPRFHPTKMRMEGDDPIEFALLMDASGDQEDLLTTFARSFGKLVPKYLHANDHLSVFAVDCKLVRTFDGVPDNPDAVREGIEAALHAPTLHEGKRRSACYDTLPLWSSVSRVTRLLSNLQGRRVILLISDGHDGASALKLADASNYAGSLGVAIFAMRGATADYEFSHSRGAISSDPFTRRPERALDLLTQANGGLNQMVRAGELSSHLQDLFTLLRNRYILEFPRPNKGDAGLHTLLVTVPGFEPIVLPTGYATPVPDPKLADDPTTVPSAPSPATMGTRRPPQPPH
jgi:hypothetical protein